MRRSSASTTANLVRNPRKSVARRKTVYMDKDVDGRRSSRKRGTGSSGTGTLMAGKASSPSSRRSVYQARKSFAPRRTMTRMTLKPSNSRSSLGKYDPRAPGLEILGRCKFLFIRRVVPDIGFLMEAVSGYEVYLPNGDRIYYIKETRGDGRRDTSGGAQRNLVLSILSSLGRELVRMEGKRISTSAVATLSVYQGPSFIGEIKENKSSCAPSVFQITDDNNLEFATIKPSESDGAVCDACLSCFKGSWRGENYEIVLPSHATKIGNMGKIANLFPEVSRDLEDCVGVELSDALNIREKTLLLASVFVVFPKLMSQKMEKRASSSTSIPSKSLTSSKRISNGQKTK